MTVWDLGTTDGRWLPDEVDVRILRHLSEGLTTERIARRVGLSERTVRRRLRAAADALEVDTSIEVVVRAVRDGLI